MNQTRRLWASIIFVLLLVTASVIGFVTGSLKPKLGLDLQGGVSVILSAPPGTSQDVLNQALENIRNRVDAFGVGEPQISLSGTNIEVQLPGLAPGTMLTECQGCLGVLDVLGVVLPKIFISCPSGSRPGLQLDLQFFHHGAQFAKLLFQPLKSLAVQNRLGQAACGHGGPRGAVTGRFKSHAKSTAARS
mgnify:CR=1 FL=1